MTGLLRETVRPLALLWSVLGLLAITPPAFAQDSYRPTLVTFGTGASEREGDHDYGQLIHLTVPDGSPRSYFRVFDADVGGAHDERYGAFNTQTFFVLYGSGSTARLYRDEAGVVREELKGTPIESVKLGVSDRADNAWLTLFAIDPARGELRDGQRHFIVSVQGLGGDDGNVFGVAVSSGQETLDQPAGTQLFSNLPTFQVPGGSQLSELGFALPADVRTIGVENFDAAGAKLLYAGRFRSERLKASGANVWERDRVDIGADEAGGPGSITVANGYELPNDVTLFAGVANDGADPINRPLGIHIPPGDFKPNQRPDLGFSMTPLGCQYLAFDAGASRDPEGGPLRYVWKLPPNWPLRPGLSPDGNSSVQTDLTDDGERVERMFDIAGMLKGRLEGFDGSGTIASGAATEFDFLSKAAPVAVFHAPDLLGEGEAFTTDGLASSPPLVPEGTRIVTYRWEMGDGTIIEQRAGDADFGRPTYSYPRYGLYEIKLTVGDDSGHPCSNATAVKSVRVNAPPIADAGGDRKAAVGEILTFDGSASSDPDGQIAEWQWTFPEGASVLGRTARHAFHEAGLYQVRLVVQDDTVTATATGSDTITVDVRYPENQRPVAVAGDDLRVAAGTPVWFDASGSYDTDGRILSHRWDFGDGSGASEPRVEHTFWKPGTYPVSLTVKDDAQTGSDFSADTLIVTVVPPDNRPPISDFPEVVEAFVGEAVTLDASASSDRDGSILAFDWDLGDGNRAAKPVLKHVYQEAGTYKASLSLMDDGWPVPGDVTRDFVVKVVHRINEAPIARFTVPTAAMTEEIISFDASASNDPDGSILSYQWDFGDGQSATGATVEHAYQVSGRYAATLRVVDDARPEDRKEAGVTANLVIADKPNIAPLADAGDDLTVARGEVLSFDARRSSDPDGVINAYLWTFGDGTTSQAQNPRHTFHDPGQYRVSLQVTDNGKAARTAEDFVTVTVLEIEPQELVQ